jgi:hypothetical protein
VENDMVGGPNRDMKVAAAKRAITSGLSKGYLREDGEILRWVPGVYVNKRVRRKP